MSKSKLGIGTIDINKKFASEKEAFNYAKRLKEYIRYLCKKKTNWQCEAMIVVSNIKGSCGFIYNEHNGKVGRPKKVREFSNFELNYYNKYLITDWHIHILIVSKPSYAFRNEIKNYIDKNWNIKSNDFDYGKITNNKKVYKKTININIAEYFIEQNARILFCSHSDNTLISKGYKLKDLYKAYLKMKTATKYNMEYVKNNNWAAKEKIDNDYKEIKNFYLDITKEDNIKAINDFMNSVKQDRISTYYTNKEENNNKVQNIPINNNRLMLDNSIF